MADEKRSSGVEELIRRLRDEGVAEGQGKAQELLEEAKRRASEMLDLARQEAENVRQEAQREAKRTQTAGEEAVRLAVRDAILTLKSEITEQFAGRVRQLVAENLSDEGFLRQVILEVVRRATPDEATGPCEILLPSEVVGVEELRRKPEEVKEGTLSHFVLTLAGDMLRQGVTFGSSLNSAPGVRVQLAKQDVQIDLTDQAITELLLKHLLPRFRALMEGIVQ
mgnify:CR=1 FL=1